MDLLIIDTQMHVDEGIKLVQQVRPACPDLPIFMIGTGQTADEVRGAILAGVDAYWAKPFTPKQLQEKVEALLDLDVLQRIEQIANKAGRYPVDRDNPLAIFLEVVDNDEGLMPNCAAARFLWHVDRRAGL